MGREKPYSDKRSVIRRRHKQSTVVTKGTYEDGARAAACVASEYDAVTKHEYRLEDCILAKLNLLSKSHIRKKDKDQCGRVIYALKLRLHAALLHDMVSQMADGTLPVDLERLKAQVEKINKQLEEVV